MQMVLEKQKPVSFTYLLFFSELICYIDIHTAAIYIAQNVLNFVVIRHVAFPCKCESHKKAGMLALPCWY